METQEVQRLKEIARTVRISVLKNIHAAHASHIGSAYSVVDLLVYLYDKVICLDPKNPFHPRRNRCILSKGWGVSALYAVLSYYHILDEAAGTSYCMDGSPLLGIATKNGTPGIEATTGSMGHGLPLGVGMALGAKMQEGPAYRVYVVIGDGELDEGSTWEAILQASHLQLDNLVVIVDANGWQSYGRTKDVLNLESLTQKFASFGFFVCDIDGHNFTEIARCMDHLPYGEKKPMVIIAHTVKGKGVTLFEDNNDWHYKTPEKKEMRIALRELTQESTSS